MAERLDEYKKLPADVKELMQEAQKLTQSVLNRVEASAKKYGAAYILADIEKELGEELDDIMGWTLLETLRMRLLLQKRLAKLDGEYLNKFLKYHDVDYLKMLRDKIDVELTGRK